MARRPDKPSYPSTAPAQRRLATVLLLHTRGAETHYDWMMEDPSATGNAAPLWTARVAHPTLAWGKLGEWEIEPIALHRREYLQYEGPLSADRGSVTRVDEGTFVPLKWNDEQIEIDVTTGQFVGRLELLRISATLWRAKVLSEK